MASSQSIISPSQAASKVHFESDATMEYEEEQARLRRGTVSADLKNQMVFRSLQGRKAVSLGYATDRSFKRSQSEASIFRPIVEMPFASAEEVDNPSNILWQSGYTQLSRVKSTSSVIGGLNDDVLRAGWRRNEPGPYWEQDHELEPDRQLMTKIEEGDGFELGDDDDLDGDGSENLGDSPNGASNNPMQDIFNADEDCSSQAAEDKLGSLPSSDTFFSTTNVGNIRRGFSKTQSMPVGGTFGSRGNQPRFYRPFDDTFMRMDEPF